MILLPLEEHYPRQQSLSSARDQFVHRISEFYADVPIENRKILESNENKHVEILYFFTDRQVRLNLKRDSETFEILATAIEEDYSYKFIAREYKNGSKTGKTEEFQTEEQMLEYIENSVSGKAVWRGETRKPWD